MVADGGDFVLGNKYFKNIYFLAEFILTLTVSEKIRFWYTSKMRFLWVRSVFTYIIPGYQLWFLNKAIRLYFRWCSYTKPSKPLQSLNKAIAGLKIFWLTSQTIVVFLKKLKSDYGFLAPWDNLEKSLEFSLTVYYTDLEISVGNQVKKYEALMVQTLASLLKKCWCFNHKLKEDNWTFIFGPQREPTNLGGACYSWIENYWASWFQDSRNHRVSFIQGWF